jgi:hypothetical protein
MFRGQWAPIAGGHSGSLTKVVARYAGFRETFRSIEIRLTFTSERMFILNGLFRNEISMDGFSEFNPELRRIIDEKERQGGRLTLGIQAGRGAGVFRAL